MGKVKDSYNCDSLAIAAATAAIRDQAWMRQNRDRIVATRTRTAAGLRELGFTVSPSQANFLWTTHASGEHQRIYEQLKERQILIRYMQFPLVRRSGPVFDGLRISVGTDQQMDTLFAALREIV